VVGVGAGGGLSLDLLNSNTAKTATTAKAKPPQSARRVCSEEKTDVLNAMPPYWL